MCEYHNEIFCTYLCSSLICFLNVVIIKWFSFYKTDIEILLTARSLCRKQVDIIIYMMLYASVQVQNPCEFAPCHEICLLAPNKSYTCACEEGKVLGMDKHTCFGELCHGEG